MDAPRLLDGTLDTVSTVERNRDVAPDNAEVIPSVVPLVTASNIMALRFVALTSRVAMKATINTVTVVVTAANSHLRMSRSCCVTEHMLVKSLVSHCFGRADRWQQHFSWAILNAIMIDGPTLTIACLAWTIWVMSWMYGSALLSMFALYMFFTPLHECSHGNFCRSSKRVNDWVGRVCGVPLLAPFSTFRAIHRMHHRFTNSEDDPDIWTHPDHLPSHPAVKYTILAFRWSTLTLHYVRWALKRGIDVNPVFFYAILACMALMQELGFPVIRVWLVPLLDTNLILGFSFDYLPHAGLGTGPENTRIVSERPVWRFLSMMQSLHKVHHAKPYLPFWRYWRYYSEHLTA